MELTACSATYVFCAATTSRMCCVRFVDCFPATLPSYLSLCADNIKYMPVSPDSFLFKAGAAWQFPAFVICLGSSYLQRMLARLPQLAEAVFACPGFEEYAAYLPELVSVWSNFV